MAKDQAQILYYAWSDKQSWHPVLTELNRNGFSCVFQGVDPVIVKQFNLKVGGSSTAQFVIVDLAEASIENAVLITQSEPRLKGRVVVVGPPVSGVAAPEGVVFSPQEKVVETIIRLHSELR